jgi:hypothetical protein
MSVIYANGSSVAATSSNWLQSSVQSFFTAFNWEDNPPEVQELKLTSMQDGMPLSMELSVSQFFSAIAWDGSCVAAAPSSAEPFSVSENNQFTLEDFSDLF